MVKSLVFKGFRNKRQLEEHISEQFPSKKIKSIKALPSAKPVSKLARGFKQHRVVFKKKS